MREAAEKTAIKLTQMTQQELAEKILTCIISGVSPSITLVLVEVLHERVQNEKLEIARSRR